MARCIFKLYQKRFFELESLPELFDGFACLALIASCHFAAFNELFVFKRKIALRGFTQVTDDDGRPELLNAGGGKFLDKNLVMQYPTSDSALIQLHEPINQVLPLLIEQHLKTGTGDLDYAQQILKSLGDL